MKEGNNLEKRIIINEIKKRSKMRTGAFSTTITG